ncbi:TonB family protein [Undibacterium sp. Di27W]|uniref:TonB family protein n=1 Tax=Undibacterium sp. Di27W TaxID=3413036 RepID=UPI003BF4B2E9
MRTTLRPGKDRLYRFYEQHAESRCIDEFLFHVLRYITAFLSLCFLLLSKPNPMMKKLFFVPLLSLLLLNVAHAGKTEIVNELISTAGKFARNPERMDVSWSLNEQAQTVAKSVQDTSPVLLLRALTQQLDLHIKSKQLEQAQKLDLQILAFKEKNPQLNDRSYAEYLHKHAELLVLQEQFFEAEKASLQAIEIFRTVSVAKIGNRLDEEFAFLGKIYMQQKNWDKAENYLKQAVYPGKLPEKPVLGTDISYKKNAVLDLIKVYQETSRDELARLVETEMQGMLKPDNPVFTKVENPKLKLPSLIAGSCQITSFSYAAIPYSFVGSTNLSFLITEDGEVAGKYISQSSGWKQLDAMALQAATSCKFQAASYEERPIQTWVHFSQDWQANSGGKPYPKPELIFDSCKSDKFELMMTDTQSQDTDFSFKIDAAGKPYNFSSDLYKKNYTLTSELRSILAQCRFKPTLINGEARINNAIMRFTRK